MRRTSLCKPARPVPGGALPARQRGSEPWCALASELVGQAGRDAAAQTRQVAGLRGRGAVAHGIAAGVAPVGHVVGLQEHGPGAFAPFELEAQQRIRLLLGSRGVGMVGGRAHGYPAQAGAEAPGTPAICLPAYSPPRKRKSLNVQAARKSTAPVPSRWLPERPASMPWWRVPPRQLRPE